MDSPREVGRTSDKQLEDAQNDFATLVEEATEILKTDVERYLELHYRT